MRGWLADLLDDSVRPPLPVLAFAALQVGGDAVMDYPSVDLETVLVCLDGRGGSFHASEYGQVGAPGQSYRSSRTASSTVPATIIPSLGDLKISRDPQMTGFGTVILKAPPAD